MSPADLVNSFFYEPNDLGKEEIREGVTAVARYCRDEIWRFKQNGRFGVFPVRKGNTTFWYGFAKEERVLRQLAEQLASFVGRTYAMDPGTTQRLDPSDPLQKLLSAYGQPIAHVLQADGNPDREEDLLRAIHRWSIALSMEVSRPPVRVSSTGRLLADLEEAIRRRDEPATEDVIFRLRSQNHLDPVNLAFVDLHKLSSFGKFQEVLDNDQLANVLQVHRPRPISLAIMAAVHAVYLASYEDSRDAEGAVRCFKEEVLPVFASLYLSSDGFTDPLALQHFLIAAIARGHSVQAREVAARLESTKSEFADALIALIPAAREEVSAPEAYERGDFDAAATAVAPAPATPEVILFLQVLAKEAPSQAKEHLLRGKIAQLSPEDAEWLKGKPEFEAYFTEEGKQLEGWPKWVNLALSPQAPRTRVLELAAQGSTEWDFSIEPANEFCVSLLNLIDTDEGRFRLRASGGDLITSAERSLEKGLEPLLIETLFDTLGEVCRTGSMTDYRLMTRVTELRLSAGVSPAAYKSLASTLDSLITPPLLAAANALGAIDLIDALAANTCPPESSREREALGQKVLASLATWVNDKRLEPSVWWAIQPLCREFHCQGLINGAAVPDTAKKHPLQGRKEKIGLYTLTAHAAERAKAEIESASQCRVFIDSSMVNTSNLKNLAQTVDLLVIATDSATHAATGALMRQRGDKPTVYADGKGSSSLLRAVYAYYD